ncbi:MAG: hypothetical protein MJK04_03725, partial [Psychrosphaera sp.]|nr:hypothetical protein [Psychrosphaera sp.]
PRWRGRGRDCSRARRRRSRRGRDPQPKSRGSHAGVQRPPGGCPGQNEPAPGRKIIRTVAPQHIYQVFEVLLKVQVNCGDDFMPETWTALFELAPDDECKKAMIKRMAEFSPAILDDIRDVGRWLSKDYWQLMLNELRFDYRLLQLRGQFNESDDEFAVVFIEAVEVIFEKTPPRLYGTCRAVVELLNKHKIYKPALVSVIEARQEIISKEKQVIEKGQKLFTCSPSNWVGPM